MIRVINFPYSRESGCIFALYNMEELDSPLHTSTSYLNFLLHCLLSVDALLPSGVSPSSSLAHSTEMLSDPHPPWNLCRPVDELGNNSLKWFVVYSTMGLMSFGPRLGVLPTFIILFPWEKSISDSNQECQGIILETKIQDRWFYKCECIYKDNRAEYLKLWLSRKDRVKREPQISEAQSCVPSHHNRSIIVEYIIKY